MSIQRDPLTGAPDRHTWNTELPISVERAKRDGEPLSIVLINIDNFQQLSDEQGLQAGNRFLKSVVAAWTSVLRPGDLLCRHGHEEFGLILPGAISPQAITVIERMRVVTPLGQTFSSGVASWKNSENPQHLADRATAALQAAKRTGRGRTVNADGPGQTQR